MLELDLCLGVVAAAVLAALAWLAGAFPFARPGRGRRGAYVALAACALLAAVAFEGARTIRTRNRAAGDFLPVPAHPKGWRHETPWTYEVTPAGLRRAPDPAAERRNALHDAVEIFAPWLALLPAVGLWAVALLLHPHTPAAARVGALAVLGALLATQAIVGPLDLSAALSGD